MDRIRGRRSRPTGDRPRSLALTRLALAGLALMGRGSGAALGERDEVPDASTTSHAVRRLGMVQR